MKLPGLLVVLATLIVPGCASLPETYAARRAPYGEVPVLKENEILVFGRLMFTENGKHKVPYGLGKPLWQLETPRSSPASPTPAEKRRIVPFLTTDTDGSFAYVVPAGRYEITHAEPLGYQPLLYPALEFDACAPGMTCHLGDVEVDIRVWSVLGGLWGNYITRIDRVEVVDRFESARDTLVRQHPQELGRVTKALLRPVPAQSPHLIEQFVPPAIHR